MILSGSQRTAITSFFPDPFGSFTTVRKLKSPPFDCFKFTLKDTSIDSSNFVLEFFLTNSKISFGESLLPFTTDFKRFFKSLRLLFHNYSLTSIPIDLAEPQIILVASFKSNAFKSFIFSL